MFYFNSNSKLLNDNINRIKHQLNMISFLINKNFNLLLIIYKIFNISLNKILITLMKKYL